MRITIKTELNGTHFLYLSSFVYVFFKMSKILVTGEKKTSVILELIFVTENLEPLYFQTPPNSC